jgi:hypothetical protein
VAVRATVRTRMASSIADDATGVAETVGEEIVDEVLR